MSRPVLVAAPAQLQFQAIDAWWRANRSASPELFAQELADAFSTIGLAPHAGHRYRHADVKGIRRVPLPATRNHVYYVPTEEAVPVLAVWGAVKGTDCSAEGVETDSTPLQRSGRARPWRRATFSGASRCSRVDWKRVITVCGADQLALRY